MRYQYFFKMLIFKNNIYNRKEKGLTRHSPTSDSEYDELFDPHHLLAVVLEEESCVLDFLGRQPLKYWPEDSKKFYPHVGKIGGRAIFQSLIIILQEGLDDPTNWHKMNTYHFCFIYDVLIRFGFNYNHDNVDERINLLPEIKGKALQVDSFIKDYFFNTVFLLDEDKYNSLSREEKLKLGYNCPCQFAVINALAPTKKEMELESSPSYPYSIYV